MDNEQRIIKKFFSPLAKNRESLNLKNDAAFLKDKNFVISTDMMIEDQHFTKDYNAKTIAKKLLRINLSDIAAMGAKPYGFFLNIAIPKMNINQWLGNFVNGLKSDMKKFNLKLFGGDLSFSSKIFLNITILGKTNNVCHSSNIAKTNSDIYVSGNIGDAPLGLKLKNNFSSLECLNINKQKLIEKFELPKPRLEIGKRLLNHAEFCTDISDGLLRELNHIAHQSSKQANIFLDRIPTSFAVKDVLKKNNKKIIWEIILSGGEDYELLFSVPKKTKIKNKIKKISNIGYFSKGKGIKIFDTNGNEFFVKKKGFSHF